MMEQINRFLDETHGGVHLETVRRNTNKILGELGARILLAAEILLYGDKQF